MDRNASENQQRMASNNVTGEGTQSPSTGMAGRASNTVISRVQEGMSVFDAAGEELGTVERITMGDPQAATVRTDAPNPGGFIEDLVDVFDAGDEPHVPDPLRSRFLRTGYIKIDGKGLLGKDSYVSNEMITDVRGDAVHLSATKDQIESASI